MRGNELKHLVLGQGLVKKINLKPYIYNKSNTANAMKIDLTNDGISISVFELP